MTRPYRIEAKVKNNRLWAAIQRSWPGVNQSQAARHLGLSPQLIGDWLNMKECPFGSGRGGNRPGWTPTAKRVAETLGELPDELFDPSLYGLGPLRAVIEAEPRQLVAAGLLQLPAGPDEEAEAHERNDIVRHALGQLTPREAEVVRRRYGLDGEEPEDQGEIGRRFARSHGAIGAIERKALRKLRFATRGVRP